MSDQATRTVEAPPLLVAAFEALDSAGTNWVLLRDSIPGVATSQDVDILVDAEWASRLDVLLMSVGYRRVPGAGQGSHRFYIGYDVPHDAWVTLDVVTEVAFGRHLEFLTPVARDVLARARHVDGLRLLHPDDAFWHRLLHYLLDKVAIPPHGHAVLRELAAATGGASPLARIVDGLRPAGLSASAVLALVRSGDTRAVDALSGTLRRAWRTRDRRRVCTRVLRSGLERAHVVGPTTEAPTGLTVAILGPDGAGKTTLAEALGRSLPLPTRLVYMGVWREYPWDAWLRPIPGARLAVRCARLTARSLQSSYHRRRGRVVLLDRFTYDAALPSPDLDWRGRVTAALVRRLSGEPDVVLLLDAPAEVMYARKGEQGLTVLARDRDSYLRLVARHPAATVIDATLPPAHVRARAHRALWRVLAPAKA